MLRLLYFLLTGYWNKPQKQIAPKPVKKPVCKDVGCGALASPLCWSQRCRAHCMHYSGGCYCEKSGLTPGEVNLISQYRQTRKAQQEKLAALSSDEQEILEEVRKVSQ